MKIVDINTNTNSMFYEDHYEPISVNGDYILSYKILIDDINIMDIGLYKHDLENQIISKVETCEPISKFFSSREKDEIFYIYGETSNRDYILHFHNLNLKNENDNEFMQFKLPRFWYPYGDGDYYEDQSAILRSIEPFSLTNRYIMFLHTIERGMDAEEKSDGLYLSYDESGDIDTYYEYKLYLYDIIDSKIYKVLDTSFIEDWHHFFQIIDIEGIDYLLVKTRYWDPIDKKEYVWGDGIHRSGDYTKYKDSVKIIPIDTLIKDTINNKEKLSYNEIDYIGVNGSIDFLKVLGTKIYYEMIIFDDNLRIFIEYDIVNDSYHRQVIPYKYNSIVSVADSIYTITFQNNTSKLTNLIKTEKQLILEAPIWLQYMIDERYIISEAEKKVGEDYENVSYIYDIESNSILNEIKGKAKVFEDESMVVIY